MIKTTIHYVRFTAFLLIWLHYTCKINAQNAPKAVKNVEVNTNQDNFHTALKYSLSYNDYRSAINAMYNIMANDSFPAKWVDSLCTLYFMDHNYTQCALTAGDALKINPSEKVMLMQAISFRSLGAIKNALNNYELLYNSFKNPFYLYQVAEMQFYLRRSAEFYNSIDNLIALKTDSTSSISLTDDGGKNQIVPIKAAAYNLKGAMLREDGKTENAKAMFEKALEIFPTFALAQNNLTLLEEKKEKTKR